MYVFNKNNKYKIFHTNCTFITLKIYRIYIIQNNKEENELIMYSIKIFDQTGFSLYFNRNV